MGKREAQQTSSYSSNIMSFQCDELSFGHSQGRDGISFSFPVNHQKRHDLVSDVSVKHASLYFSSALDLDKNTVLAGLGKAVWKRNFRGQ